MDIPLDEVIHFDAISSGSTGVAVDADSTPTFAVYEESTDTDIGIGGSMTKRTSLTGNYRGSFTASAANGFELGKWYNVIGSATIGGIACKGILRSFRVIAAEAVAGYPPADSAKIGGQTASASGTVTFPNATLASTTNITAGTITTATNLTNLPAMPTDWLTSTGLAASVVTEIWAGVTDSSGITTLLSRLSSTRAGYLDNLSAGAVALASTFTGMTSLPQWLGAIAGKQTPNSTALTEIRATGAGSGTFDATTDSNEALRDNTGTAGAGLTAADDAVISAIGALNNITAASVWDLNTSGHTTSGTFGAAMNAAGSAGDPWATSLPGAYGSGTAGYIVGNNADSAGVTTLLSRLSSARAGYLDNLNSGVPLATDAVNSTSLAPSAVTEFWASNADSSGVTTLLSRLTSTRAGYLDNLSAGAVATAASIAALNNISTSQVLTQVNAALDTALTLPGQANPSSTPSLREAVAQITQLAIRKTVANKDTGIQTVYAANGTTPIQTRTLADDGSAFILGPLISA